jgi:hypothetical protein
VGRGPIDWNCNSVLEAHVAVDIDRDNGTPNRTLHDFDDWSHVKVHLQIPPDVTDQNAEEGCAVVS